MLLAEREADGRWVSTDALRERAPRSADAAIRLAALGEVPPWAEVVELVAAAEASGWRVGSVLLDVDVPEASLETYADSLRELRALLAPRPLHVLALPSWLGPSWPALVAAVDRPVLQVHGLQVPEEGEPWIFRSADAEAWVRTAAESGPLRVALPTHGWRVTTVGGPRAVRAEPTEVLRSLAAWRADAPAGLEGVDWFRLPVAGDAGTWSPATWEAVRAGRPPATLHRAVVASVGPTTWEVVVEATGEDRVVAPRVELLGDRLVGEGVGGFVFRALPDGGVLEPVPERGPSPIQPGERRVVGFVRAPAAPVLREAR